MSLTPNALAPTAATASLPSSFSSPLVPVLVPVLSPALAPALGTALRLPDLRRFALPVLFGWYGLAMGAWAGRLPAVQQGLSLSHAQLSLVLLCAGIGAVLSPQVSSRLLAGLSRLRTLRLAGMALPTLLLAASLAPSLPLLMLAVLMLGMAASSVDVAMNGIAAHHESRAGRPMMARLHACACAGGLAGVTLGSAMAALQVTAAQQFSLLALPLAALALICVRALDSVAISHGSCNGNDNGDANATGVHDALRKDAVDSECESQTESHAASHGRTGFVLPNRRIALLGTLGLLGAVAEGSVGNWSILFMKDQFGASDAVAPLSLSAFTMMMLVSRSVGDRLKARHGARRLLCCGSLLAACGLGLAVFAPGVMAALAGFALAGLGLALVYPFVFSAAGREGSIALSGVATMTYAGGLMGPPMMGAMAEGLGLQAAIAAVGLLALAIAIVASRVRLLK